jgi:uncharacterized protein (DUF1330 family)
MCIPLGRMPECLTRDAIVSGKESGEPMAKAYWISCYRQIIDPAKLAAYARLAGPAIEAGGGRFLARTTAAKAYEDGKTERTVLVEFDSIEQAVAVHDSAAYQAALAALEGGVVRDLRIVPGV